MRLSVGRREVVSWAGRGVSLTRRGTAKELRGGRSDIFFILNGHRLRVVLFEPASAACRSSSANHFHALLSFLAAAPFLGQLRGLLRRRGW
jgi:hypothetical protein